MANFNVMEYLKNRHKEETAKLTQEMKVSEEEQMMQNINREETEMELKMQFGGAF